jgi:periplasmic protein TonB
VLALHAATASLLLSRRIAIELAAAPPAAVMIELAPLPAPVPAEPQPAPQAEATRPPSEPEPPTLTEPEPMPVLEPAMVPPPPEPVAAPQPAVTLPLPQSKPNPKPKAKPRTVDRLPPPEASTNGDAGIAAAGPGTFAAGGIAAVAERGGGRTGDLAGAAARLALAAKRYPRAAQDPRQQGTAHLRFALDRHGRVLSFRLDRSSGVPALDEEVTSLIQRAQPLPPAEVPGERFELVLPVEFSLDGYRR